MKSAICSDIHDNIWILEKALTGMQDADALLFCGDFCAPFTLVQIAEGFAGQIHVVWGNNDGDKWLLTNQAHRFGKVELHGELGEIELGGWKVAINHYPEIAQGLVQSGNYDLVCYGHNHQAHNEKVGETRFLNPGELMGRFGTSGYAVVETSTGEVEFREVERKG